MAAARQTPIPRKHRSLAARIRRAAFTLTMLVLLVIGAASLALSLWEIPREQTQNHTNTLRIIGERMAGSLRNRLGNLEQLSRNPMVWNALTDSAERELYLKPFLASRNADSMDKDVLLLDYRGRPVAGQLQTGLANPQLNDIIGAVLRDKRPRTLIGTASPMLLAAYPVLFPYTQDVIGVLVAAYDLDALFRANVIGLDNDHGVTLFRGDTVLAQTREPASERTFPVRFALPLPGAQGDPGLQLELYSSNHQWLRPGLLRLAVYLAAGLAFTALAWYGAGRVAASLTGRLNRLALACSEVAEGKPFRAEEDRTGDEIGMLSRTLRQALLAYEEIQAHLEYLVAARTRDLAESQERYRQAFEVNTAIKLIVDPTDGRIVDTNEAACTFYGYPRAELLRLRIADLNILPADSIQAEMAQARLEQRLYFNFRHRLASGELRDVEVYSGPISIGGKFFLHSIIHDVSDRKRAEAALRDSQARFQSLFESIGDAVYVHGLRPDGMPGTFIECNRQASAYTGYSREELLSMSPLELDAPDSGIDIGPHIQGLITGEYVTFEQLHIGKTGQCIPVEIHAHAFTLNAQTAIISIVRDISARKQAEVQLRLAASVFQHSHEGILLSDADNRIVDVNAAFTRITGYSRAEVLGQNPNLLNSGRQDSEVYAGMWANLKQAGFWQGEVWNRRKNGEIYPELLTISAVSDAHGKIQHYVGVFADISHIKRHQQELERIAHFDALTNLPNRVLLADRLHQAMVQAERRGQRLAVIYLDLDGFKEINDSYGHEAGDQLLIALAARMKLALREGDTIARLGGDEFVAVSSDLADVEASVPMLTRLLAAAAQPVRVGDSLLQVSASLGVTFYPQAEAADADKLLRQADQAMYQAKLAGKNRYHIFDAEHDRSVRGHHENLERIRSALSEREFVLHYQPKVNMRSGQIIGAEALIRWQHPQLGLLPPDRFLPTIEDHPLAVEIGEWVIDTALAQMKTWRAGGLNLRLSVNVGANQLQQGDFTERLRALLARHAEIDPADLVLEVLESSALTDMEHVSRVMHTCGEMGVRFALDDFGTGYSSLTYLKRLPAAQLKIDRSFVSEMLDDPDDLAILEGVLGLATAFGRQAIAEGVENVEQGEMLLQLGCELAQGYGIARPMPAAQLPAWAAAWQTDPRWRARAPISRIDLPLLFASVEHRAWVRGIEIYLKGGNTAPPSLDYQRCRFGCWLEGEGQARYGDLATFQNIETLHRQVYALARQLVELRAQQGPTKAQQRLGELHNLRDRVLALVQELIQTDLR